MPTTADSLRDLHILHQRAMALRDRMSSGPKTLAARQNALEKRKKAIEDAKTALMALRSHAKNREMLLQGQQAKSDDLRVKLNAVKKNEEYKAIQNQLAHDKSSMGKLEDELLNDYSKIEEQVAALAASEAELAKLTAEIAALKVQLDAQVEAQQAQLREFEAAIVEAEEHIPEAQIEQYRRNVKQRGADALASVEHGACSGCFLSVPAQMVNELIRSDKMIFCNTCGRILYLADENVSATMRTGR